MDAEALFVETVEDLRRRCDLRGTEYDMVQASGLIRRLLMDASPLWHQVNREFRSKPPIVEWMPIRMVVRAKLDAQVMAPGLMLDPVIASAMTTLSGSEEDRGMLDLARRSGTFEQFLSSKVIDRQVAGQPRQVATVRDLIRHYANREGGVHHDPGGKSTNDFIEEIRDFADEDLRLIIVACGRIIVRALEPMAAALTLKDIPWPAGLDFRFPPPD